VLKACDVLKAFVDGSHIKGTDRLGYGILCQCGNEEYALSCHPVTSASLGKILGKSLELCDLSNPTMEFIAVAHFLSLVANDRSKRFRRVEIYYDYIGSEKWINGSWKPRQPHIQTIHKFVMPHVARLKSLGVQLEWIHVLAHSGHRENNMADALAKGELDSQNDPYLQPLSNLFPCLLSSDTIVG
jgi:ribonuclease HI